MSEEDKQIAQGSDAQGQGNGVDDGTMEDLIGKLKLLHYETRFCQSVKPPFKPLRRNYFSGPCTLDNPNAQFYYFTSLCSWLMKLSGHDFDPPGQFDDPNASATNVIAELRALGIPTSNLAPTRVKQGSGEAVLIILMALVDRALRSEDIKFLPIDYSKVEKYDELADVEDAAGDGEGADVEDNVSIGSGNEDDVYVRAGAAQTREEAILPIQSSVNPEEWNLEVERVDPLLQIRTDEFENWRSRSENASVLLEAIKKIYPEVKSMLHRMQTELEQSQSLIQNREKTLAQQFSDQVEDYRVKLKELNTSKSCFKVSSESVQQLTAELNQVTESLDQTKKEIEDRETKLADTTPLIQVKEAVAKVRAEIQQMALRIGVLQHTVCHNIMTQTKEKRERRGTDMDENFMDDTLEGYYA